MLDQQQEIKNNAEDNKDEDSPLNSFHALLVLLVRVGPLGQPFSCVPSCLGVVIKGLEFG